MVSLAKKIIALDIATKTGFAVLTNDTITVSYIEGSPVFQIGKILQEITPNTIIVIEDFSYFTYPNPVTTATLNQRLGYIYWRLIECGLNVLKYNVNTVRKHLNISGKKSGEQKKAINQQISHAFGVKLTTDESDAIALLLYNTQLQISDLYKFKLIKHKRCVQNVQKPKRKNKTQL